LDRRYALVKGCTLAGLTQNVLYIARMLSQGGLHRDDYRGSRKKFVRWEEMTIRQERGSVVALGFVLHLRKASEVLKGRRDVERDSGDVEGEGRESKVNCASPKEEKNPLVPFATCQVAVLALSLLSLSPIHGPSRNNGPTSFSKGDATVRKAQCPLRLN